jgi:hypothetical protein
MFDTKIAIVLREDLAPWQALNVTAFLAAGIAAQHPEIIGESYIDGAGNRYSSLLVQPVIVLAAPADAMRNIHRRALERGIVSSAYVEEMFATGHDAANREVFSRFVPEEARVVGIGLRAERKLVDKVAKGARMHP